MWQVIVILSLIQDGTKVAARWRRAMTQESQWGDVMCCAYISRVCMWGGVDGVSNGALVN